MSASAATGEVTVTLPDGRRMEVPSGTSVRDVAFRIGSGLGKATVGARFDGQDTIQDLRTPLDRDLSLQIVTADSESGLQVIRHSCAHVLADAVLKLWPEARLAIGPAVADGFYYDIDLEHKINPEDFEALEAEMKKIVKADTEFTCCEVDREQVTRVARERGDIYKAELLEGLAQGERVTFYQHGNGSFEDLCRGPHVPSTGYIKAFKLMRVAGSYWRGDENNKMLQRIYGTAWWRAKDLEEHLSLLAEAERRDHRKLGRELGLFMIRPDIAPASPFFLPRGAHIYHKLVDWMRGQYRREGYQEVITPQIFNVALWHRSGHYEHYKDNMFFTTVDSTEYAVKPMNCPGHTYIYSSEKRSFRDLPLRLADFGRLHRYERSGVTSGLTRVRTFCQDDAHIFCRRDQVQDEIARLLKMVDHTYKVFGFEDIRICLSTRPEKSVGTDEIWQEAEEALKQALDASGIDFTLNPGDGAFYGPKIDFEVRDALKRSWQLGTVQLDFSAPERFELAFVTSAGSEERPVMIHRAIFGSLERFFGILIEHTGGNFPFWMAPEQARVITINNSHDAYARRVAERIEAAGFLAQVDDQNAKIGAKIRAARLQRIPYVLVVGDRELETQTVALREHPDKNLGPKDLDEVLALFLERNRSMK